MSCTFAAKDLKDGETCKSGMECNECIFSNLNVGCNWHFNVGIDSIAHECVASGTKNALIVGTPNSILSTGDQGVLVGTPIFNLEYW